MYSVFTIHGEEHKIETQSLEILFKHFFHYKDFSRQYV